MMPGYFFFGLLMLAVVNTPSFLKTFDTPGANVTATIVAIYDGE